MTKQGWEEAITCQILPNLHIILYTHHNSPLHIDSSRIFYFFCILRLWFRRKRLVQLQTRRKAIPIRMAQSILGKHYTDASISSWMTLQLPIQMPTRRQYRMTGYSPTLMTMIDLPLIGGIQSLLFQLIVHMSANKYVYKLPPSNQFMMQHQLELKQKPTFQNIMQGECMVCFVPYGKVVPKRIDQGLEILFCGKCYMHVHKCCYDMEANLTVVTEKISEFTCERCKGVQVEKENDHCLVCYGEDGAMKRINNELIHVYCGLIHNDIQVLSYYPTLSFKKSIHYDQTSHSCELCKRKNAHEQCAEESCRRKVHVYCAKTHYVALAKESDDEPKAWNHRISTGNHGNFDLSDQVIPYELLSQEVEVNLKEVEELGIDLSSKEEFKRRVHKGYLQQTRSRRKSTKKLRRGGFSFVLCPSHETATYCSCFGKADGEEMVLCQCCFEWYHHKCIKIAATNDSYVCQYCRTFYEFKRKAIDQMRGGRSDYDVGRVQLPLKVSLMDCMWVMRVLDNRIRGGLALKMLKELYKYPLKSSCMDLLIRQQNRNKLTALADECLTLFAASEQLTQALKPKVVLAADAQGKPYVVLGNVEYNRLLRKGVQLLSGTLRGQGFAAILKELDFKERALSDSYEQIIELSKVEQPYQEVQILKQKAQAYNFIEIIRKIKQNTPVYIQELQNAITKANSVSSLPKYLTETLKEKYNNVAPILQKITKAINTTPENTYQITQLVQQLQNEHILPPMEYLQLMAEKKVVQGLYLFFIKQQGNKMQQELTIGQQLQELLNGPMLRPTQELVDILAAYRPINGQTLIWPHLKSLLQKYQGVAIDFQIREISKRKFCKQEKFLSIIERVAQIDIGAISEQGRNIINGWKDIKGKYDALFGMPTEELIEYDALAEGVKIASTIIQNIQNFPIRLEEEGAKAILAQAKTRRDELEQLRVLLTQSQLQKNPLTLSKLLPTLPKGNPLVKQWHSLKKQQSSLQSKFTSLLARINQRLQYFKTQKKLQRKQQIKQNGEKPNINEVTELIQILKHSTIDMSRQWKELTRIINNSLEVGSRVRKYIEQRGDCSLSSLDELSTRRKQIEQQRKRVLTIAQISLKSELVQLFHLEICNRMRTSLLSPGLDLEKINMQLKFAEEEGLMHTETYLALKEKYQTKNQKSKEVNQLKNIELSLATEASRDSSYNFSGLFVYRKGLSIPQLPQSKTKNSYIDDLADRNRQLRQKLGHVLQQIPSKWQLGQARTVYLQALKNPYFQPQLNRMSVQITKAWQLLKRWKELGRAFNHLHPIFLDYQLLSFTIQQIQTVKRQIKNNQDEIARLDYFLNSFDQANRDHLQEIIQRIQTSGVIRETQICKQAQQKYIKYWTRLLQCCKNAKRLVPYEKMRRLTIDAYNLLQKSLRLGENHDQLKTCIYQLQDYLILVKNHLKCYPSRASNSYIADSFIDLQELYLENDDEDIDLADLIPLLRPFSDLSKFRMKNLQRLQFRREQLNSKRSRDKLDQLRLDERPSAREIQPSSSSQAPPQAVSQTQRKKIKQIFLKNIRKNPELRRYGQCQNEVKMIQNQIFGEWHNDIVKYFQMSQQFQKLFIKLIQCPNISGKVIKKKFQFKFIQILVSNLHKIDQLQGMIITKIKQIQTQKTITKISQSIAQKSIQKEKERQRDSEAVMQSIATGKVDESLKQDLKKEMKLLKQGKHKKKKHHKHRSRSKSPDAKFSSESQKQLPSYIQNEYNKDESKTQKKMDPLMIPKQSQSSPLRYDPQEDELQNKQFIFPKGSILKLKSCQLEIVTKKKGKVEFPVEILTQEQHKKILADLFDPGFTRLSIKKDKNQAQIIQYISKSKKKYKYLVCWFQAVKADDNQLLKQIAVDANQKRKIFGWQNQHIKIHIMSMRQLVQVGRFNAPAKVSSAVAANYLTNERVVMVVQYPQKVYEIRDNYKQFADIQRKTQEFPTFVPQPIIQPPQAYDFYPKYTMPTIEPLNKPPPTYDEQKMVYQGGWGNDGPINLPMPPSQTIQPVQPIPPLPMQNILPMQSQQLPQNNLPYKINQIRLHFGINSFSPILTDQDDEDDRNNGDLASDLLNSLGDFKMPAQPQPTMQPMQQPREKAPPAQQQQQQQYQGYYSGYGYQGQPQQSNQRPIQPAQNRWMDYRGMSQMGQPQGGQVYNPLNPMAGKYSAPPQPQMGQMQGQQMQGQMQGQQMSGQMQGQMYKNPMMDRSRQPQMGQYYRPPGPNEGYDRRYQGQGGYQQ